MRTLLRKKDVIAILNDAGTGNQLRKALTAWDLTLLGIGAIVGAGIFVVTGVGAVIAGPGLSLSFVIASVACGFAALSYAEFSASIPVSGSVYTYTYITMGEFLAWLIGWDLVLEYALGSSAVAVCWSGYFQSFLSGLGITLPVELSAAFGALPGQVTWFNLPAFSIMMLVTAVLSRGVKESARFNNTIVAVKLLVIILFIAIGSLYVHPHNWQPFAPFGTKGVLGAAAIIFFAYIGFDAVSSAAEEVKNPARDLPRGILYSLGICTCIYVAVTLVMTGIVPYSAYTGISNPVSFAILSAGQGWFGEVINIGALLGMTTVILVNNYGQTRIFFAMSRDRLIPAVFARVHPVYKTPFASTWIIGIAAGLISAVLPLDKILELTNLGTLVAFCIVSLAVIIMRRTQPNLPRKFRCPCVPLIPLAAILSCAFLMMQLDRLAWVSFLGWLGVGLVIYFAYSRRKSALHAYPKYVEECDSERLAV